MDISQLQTNVKGRGRQNSGKKNKELIIREEVEGTPFIIVTDKLRKVSFIGMGSYRLSEETEDKKELERRIKEKDWMFQMHVMNAMMDANKRMEKETQKEY